MKAILPVPMPHWSGDRLEYFWCTGCAWRYAVDGRTDEATATEVKAAFAAHDCAIYQQAS